MATRAVHLECVTDNTTFEFLLAIRRFFARRGTPTSIISDNAPTFKLGAEILTNSLLTLNNDTIFEKLTQAGIKWSYITPLTPFQGGFYERLVGSVKSALYKTITNKTLTRNELETIICECEMTVNSRPLCKLTNLEDKVIRPIDFIHPHYNTNLFNTPYERDDSDYTLREALTTQEQAIHQFRQIDKHLSQFWSFWTNIYLTELREHHKRNLQKGNNGSSRTPQVGDIILVSDQQLPRHRWPLAIVTALHPSHDGHIRTVSVRIGQRTFERSIIHLIPVELASSVTEQHHHLKKDTPIRTQPTRLAKSRAIAKMANDKSDE
jgi:hypothetical protein